MSYNSRTVVIEVETRYGVCNYSSVDTLCAPKMDSAWVYGGFCIMIRKLFLHVYEDLYLVKKSIVRAYLKL